MHGVDELGELMQVRAFDELVLATAKISEEREHEVAERCAGAGIVVRRFRIAWDEVK